MAPSSPILQVEQISKRYRLGVIGRQSLAEELRYWTCRLRGRDPGEELGELEEGWRHRAPGRLASQMDQEHPGYFWSLRDVSFSIGRGEVVGVVGANGAGKSTLLKILARITEPTEGRARIAGRMSALLEVGTGFHPELTGRENVFVNGAILGMGEREIRAKFDAIVAFAEVEDFIDTPVKRYSSGMRARLAFAVAAHLEPDVLLLDEVLSVGDASFQRKCVEMMRRLAGRGRTVLIVSHRISTLSEMCGRTLWLDKGRLRMDGDTEDVLSRYLEATTHGEGEKTWEKGKALVKVPGLRLYAFRVIGPGGEVVAAPRAEEAATVEVVFEWEEGVAVREVGFEVATAQGQTVFEAFPGEDVGEVVGRVRLLGTIPGGYLTPGPRLVSLLVRPAPGEPAERVGKPLLLEVLPGAGAAGGRGMLRLPVRWRQEEGGRA